MNANLEKRRAGQGDRMQQRILKAALRIFAEQGYARVSMRKIAAQINCSPTAIYRHFRAKQELLQAIAAETGAGLAARFAAVRAAAGRDPLATLRSLLQEYIAFCVERPEMFRLYSDLGSFELEDGAMYERLGAGRQRVYQSWQEGIRRCRDSGRLAVADETRVFLYLWDAVNGYIDHRINHPKVGRRPLAEDAPEFLELLFGGIAAKTKTKKTK